MALTIRRGKEQHIRKKNGGEITMTIDEKRQPTENFSGQRELPSMVWTFFLHRALSQKKH